MMACCDAARRAFSRSYCDVAMSSLSCSVVMRACASACSRFAFAWRSAAVCSRMACWAALGSKRITVWPCVTGLLGGASQTICRSDTRTGAESCMERSAANSPRQRTSTRNSPRRALAMGRSAAASTFRNLHHATTPAAAVSASTKANQ